MGNAEVKAIVESRGTVDDEALLGAHRQFLCYGDDFFPIDRSAFALFFRDVPFAHVDQVYDALLEDAETRQLAVLYRDLVVPLAIASTLSPEHKCRLMYDVFVAALPEPSESDVSSALATALVQAVVPMRGWTDPESGKVHYTAFRCHACRQVPANLVFLCEQCPTAGSVMGVPAGCLLCKACAGVWEGPGTGGAYHSMQHRQTKLRYAPNPKTVSFPGTTCAACSMSPIVGPRLRCLECTDQSQLCAGCYAAGASPGAHAPTHAMDSIRTPQTVTDEVARLVVDLGFPVPSFPRGVPPSRWALERLNEVVANSSKATAAKERGEVAAPLRPHAMRTSAEPLQMAHLLSPEAWTQWCMGAERLLPVLGGHCSHYIPRCPMVETYERIEVHPGSGTE